jgi:integrase
LDGFPSLATARKLAQEALDKVAEGGNPAMEKRAARQAWANAEKDHFEEVARKFIAKHAKPNTPRTWKQTASRLGFIVSPDDESLSVKKGGVVDRWGKRPIGEIKKRDVIELLDSILDRGMRVMATNVYAVIRKLFNWAVGKDIIAASPCTGVETPHKVESRDRVLNDKEICRLWDAGGLGYPFGHIAKLLLLTGQRRDEVAGLRWSEIDLKRRVWSIPRERAKNDKTHDVALSEAALAVIAEVEATARVRGNKGYLFTTTGETAVSGFSRVKKTFDKLIGDMPPWRFHDLRRTVATGMQRLNVRLEVTEAVLGHISGSRAGIVGIYQRHDYADEKCQALDAWARLVLHLVEERPADNVVSLREQA